MAERILDARPARELTSREYARLLGSMLGVLMLNGTEVKLLWRALALVLNHLQASDALAQAAAVRDIASESDRAVVTIAALLGGTLRGWIEIGTRQAVVDAVRFYVEKPEALQGIADGAASELE